MKHKRDAALTSLCAEVRPGDGIPPRLLKRQKQNQRRKQKQSRPAADRHTLQYCKEAKRSLDGELAALALTTGSSDNESDTALHELTVLSVEPLPGSSALLVIVRALSVTQEVIPALEARLQAASGRLRAAIAGDTHRKRVPHLRFRVVPGSGQL